MTVSTLIKFSLFVSQIDLCFCISAFDNIDPVIENCPASFTVPVLPTETTVEVSWVEPTTPENATFTSNFQPGDSFPVGNDTEVIYSLVDEAGNLATCSFTVSVIRK